MKPRSIIAAVVMLASSVAFAEPKVTVSPKNPRPGDAVLVTVTGAKQEPKGTVAGTRLAFFRAKTGYQALHAIPIEAVPERIEIDVDGAKRPAYVVVREVDFPETDVIVEEEYANPPAAERTRIDADNRAIVAALSKDVGEPMFTRAFRRPRGEVTSPFGEWRTFNDGHRSQHLGLDVFAREGTKVAAANAGIVTLVRDTFLAGNVVVVAHGGGIATAYFHLREISVDEGDRVEAGDEVGRAGQTGRTTGPHLHLAARVPGGFVNPASFFRLAIAPASQPNARRASQRRR